MAEQTYKRDPNGVRLDLTGGMNTVLSPDLIPPGQGYPYLQNVRRLLQGRVTGRPMLSSSLLPVTISPAVSMIRINDPYLPAGWGLIIVSATGDLNVWDNGGSVITPATGLSGLPVGFVIFRPNASPQPWCFLGDGSMAVTISNPAFPTMAYPYAVTGMLKVRSDSLTYKMGIAEPQAPPTVTTGGGTGPNWVIYRYTYRSSITGAVSNPSPESQPQIVPQSNASHTMNAGLNANVTYNPGQYTDTGSFTYLETQPIASGILTDYVIAKNFGLTLPDNVTIDGVLVTLNWAGQNAGTGILSNVSLYYQGSQLGNPKSPAVQNLVFVGPGGTDAPQGGNTDMWGAVLTPAIVNDPSFGFGVQIATVQSGSTNRSFLYTFKLTVYYTIPNTGVSGTASADPQVDKIDFYRQDPGLNNFTYVGTVPNGTSTYTDTLSDLDIAANPLLEFDNFEPFPSIDLPRKGMVNVAANGAVTWVSGDVFNVRWLPGTVILIGGSSVSGSAVAYTLYNRPTSTTSLTAVLLSVDPTTGFPRLGFPPPGTGLTYEIPEPSLAAQASPVIWGPTPDNAGSFYFGLDPLNPGDLLWSKGNNFDSAPDTNRMYVTSPSETLMNGTVTSELSTVFSTDRFWLIYPNFADAVATVTGTEGQQWTLIQSSATRGLYMRYAICALGSMIAYRAKDCIALSMGGQAEESITDSIYNLFPHGGSVPQPVTLAGNITVYPPNDNIPNAQTITMTPGYIFYNYEDTGGTSRTLVYDIVAKGWIVDLYNPNVICHLWSAGPVNQLLVGCRDGSARAMQPTGTELSNALIVTRPENGDDTRALKRVGDVFVKAQISPSGNTMQIMLWQTQVTQQIFGFNSIITGTGALTSYIVDFTQGHGVDVDDVAAIFFWPLTTQTMLELWQPDWTELPEMVQDRPSDWDDGGSPQNKFYQGFLLECNTFGQSKNFQVQSDDGTLHTPVEVPFVQNGQAIRTFTFNPPFTAHMVRIISTDGVPWQFGPSGGWSTSWMTQPSPESSTEWTTEASTFGLLGYIHAYEMNLAYYATAPVTFTLTTDQGVFTLNFPAAGTAALPAKILQKFPRNKWKIASISCTSSAPIQIYKDWSELWLKSWGSTGEYVKQLPFGGQASPAAEI